MSDPASSAQVATAPPPKRGRYPQTALALIGAVIGCLGIVAFLVLVVVRPDGATRAPTDWHAAAADAAVVLGPEILDPVLPDGWTANYARIGTDGDATTWEIGFLTPTDRYVGLTQTLRATDGTSVAVPDLVGDPTGTIRVDGREWIVFDQRIADPIGNYSYNLATELPSSLVLLHGTGTDAEFETVATAIVAEADR